MSEQRALTLSRFGLFKRRRKETRIRERIDTWVMNTWGNSPRRRMVRKTIRELWHSQLPHWLGVHAELLREAHAEGLDGEAAAQEALEDLQKAFMVALEGQLVRQLDQRVRWLFIGNPVWRALLEKHDGTLFATLVSAARVSANLVIEEVPMLDAAREQIDKELVELLTGLEDMVSGEAPEVIEQTPTRKVRSPLIKPTAAPLAADWRHAPELVDESVEVLDDEDADEDADAPTVVTEEPGSAAEGVRRVRLHAGTADRAEAKERRRMSAEELADLVLAPPTPGNLKEPS